MATTTISPTDTAIPGTPCPEQLRHVVLARVSDGNRRKFESNLADDLDWLTWSPEAAWVKQHVTSGGPFRSTSAGEAARRQLGMTPVYAKGTGALIGAQLRRGEWLFVFLLVTAAKADLPDGGNSATEAIKDVLRLLATADPHDEAGRSTLHCHALDRILRSELYGWQIFDELTSTYVLVDAAGRRFDALAPNAKDEYTLIAFGASRGRDDTARRFQIKRLNKARSGSWPGNELALPHGFRASADQDPEGRWHLDPQQDPRGDQRRVRRPEPDPRQRWSVQLIAELYAQPLSYSDIAVRAGKAGLTAKGVDEQGTRLSELSDLTSAGKKLLSPAKIRAYLTGHLAYTEIGVTAGQFTPGDGHRLVPRYDGDRLGAVTYDVNVGRPEDAGWDWGVSRCRWRHILQTRYLPDGFQPNGWSWDDVEWDWDELLAACRRTPKRAPTGRHAANQELRPLSGLIAYTDGDSRTALWVKTGVRDPRQERYEWRQESLLAARRSQATGEPYAMSSRSGIAVSSWRTSELHAVVAEVLTQAVTDHLDDTADLDRLLPAPAPVPPGRQRGRDAAEAKQREAKRLRHLARGYGLKAAQALADGDATGAAEDSAEQRRLRTEADDLDVQASRLSEAATATPPEEAPRLHDFGEVATVIGALLGAFAAGPAPRELNAALARLFRDTLRLAELDAATAQISGTVHLPLSDGRCSVLEVPFRRRIGRSRLRRTSRAADGTPIDRSGPQRQQRAHALGDAFWRQGGTVEELLVMARSTDAEHWAKQMRLLAPDYLTSRISRPELLRALVLHPHGSVRALLSGGPAVQQDTAGAKDDEYVRLLARTYFGDTGWTPRTTLDPHADGRLAAVTVLAARLDPTLPIRADHLAELAGQPRRAVVRASTSVFREAGFTLPATLTRAGGWRGKAAAALDPQRRTVALPPCPWPDCPSLVAAGLCLLPEVVIGCGTTSLCLQCERPPTTAIRLRGYGDLCAPHLTGSWQRCLDPSCERDLGAGAGIVWQFDAHQSMGLSAHDGCRAAA